MIPRSLLSHLRRWGLAPIALLALGGASLGASEGKPTRPWVPIEAPMLLPPAAEVPPAVARSRSLLVMGAPAPRPATRSLLDDLRALNQGPERGAMAHGREALEARARVQCGRLADLCQHSSQYGAEDQDEAVVRPVVMRLAQVLLCLHTFLAGGGSDGIEEIVAMVEAIPPSSASL